MTAFKVHNTLFVGKFVQTLDQTPSTNSYLQALVARSTPPEGTVVVAHHQTDGRGQMGSTWVAPPHQNLTLSVLFYPRHLAAVQQFALSEAVALAIYDTARAFVPATAEVAIKWSNDLYINQRKAGGVLIENALEGNRVRSSIVGIGFNVLQTVFDTTLATRATSLTLEGGDVLLLNDVFEQLCAALEARYLQLIAALRVGDTALLHTEYLSRLYRFGTQHYYQRTADGSFFEGTIVGVAPTGLLQIRNATTDKVESFAVKEVAFVMH